MTQSNNPVIIQDFMCDSLHLYGVKLIAYATIYSNCIVNSNKFVDKYRLVEKYTGLSQQAAKFVVNELVDCGLIFATSDLLCEELTYSCTAIKASSATIMSDTVEIFTYWNSKNIIRHKDLTEAIKSRVVLSVKRFGKDKILMCIDRYAEILKSNFFFDYRWSLIDFLKRKDGIESFSDDGSKWNSYVDWCSKNHIRRDTDQIVVNSDGSINL